MADRSWSSEDIAPIDRMGPSPPLPVEYYRRQAARVRELASQATTAAIKDHLRDVALQYERLAERVAGASASPDEH